MVPPGYPAQSCSQFMFPERLPGTWCTQTPRQTMSPNRHQGTWSRHPAKSCSQKAFREHGSPRIPCETMLPTYVPRQASGNMVSPRPPAKSYPQNAFREYCPDIPRHRILRRPSGITVPPQCPAKAYSHRACREHGYGPSQEPRQESARERREDLTQPRRDPLRSPKMPPPTLREILFPRGSLRGHCEHGQFTQQAAEGGS